MSAAIMPPAHAPHRKPLPGYAPPSAMPGQPTYQQQAYQRQPCAGGPPPPNGAMPPTNMTQQQQQQQQPLYGQPARRTLSNATASTSSTTHTTAAGLQRTPTTSAFSTASGGGPPRRSTSSRSTASAASPTSYVALMRKQKATVWCDRAQHEDPRILAAQRAAKQRAAMDVAGGGGHHHASSAAAGGRTSTSSSGMVGGVRSKMRHHGAPKASTYTGGPNLLGGAAGGVPMRLSATEVDEGESDDEGGAAAAGYGNKYHSRTGSGRSSLGSEHRGQHLHSSGAARGYSNGSTPSGGPSPVESMGDLAEEETPVPDSQASSSQGTTTDYFAQPGGQGGSGSSGEEARFGNAGKLPERRRQGGELGGAVPSGKTAEELRRRGSVDDRTMTMGGGRLFVANPDLSD
ncbi:hypothetical protein LTR53_002420 [Teratosphaeriaceae sp. CCFEE 6253]|nr:hypothetical protein LTR53_002420 [Teratosphaeriaceae sp. CCFEE 6253]